MSEEEEAKKYQEAQLKIKEAAKLREEEEKEVQPKRREAKEVQVPTQTSGGRNGSKGSPMKT